MVSVAKKSRYARQHTASNNLPLEFDDSTKQPSKKVKKKRHRFWHKAEYYIIKVVLILTTVIVGLAFLSFAAIHAWKFLEAAMK
jgi:hypothetical protein